MEILNFHPQRPASVDPACAFGVPAYDTCGGVEASYVSPLLSDEKYLILRWENCIFGLKAMSSRGKVSKSIAVAMILVIILASTATVSGLDRSRLISTISTSPTSSTSGFFISSNALTSISQTSASTSGLSGLTVQSYDTTVPPLYQSQYSSVQNLLNKFNSSLRPTPSSKNNFTYAAELLPANGNPPSSISTTSTASRQTSRH